MEFEAKSKQGLTVEDAEDLVIQDDEDAGDDEGAARRGETV
jgi:hypothetical protein